MKITVVGAALIVAGVVVFLLLLNAVENKNGGPNGTQPPQGPQPNIGPFGV